MEQTSLDAWNDIQKDLGEKQMEVFNLFTRNGINQKKRNYNI
jgi:hypothetical protein